MAVVGRCTIFAQRKLWAIVMVAARAVRACMQSRSCFVFCFRFVHAAVDLCTEEYESKQMVPYLALLLIFHIK